MATLPKSFPRRKRETPTPTPNTGLGSSLAASPYIENILDVDTRVSPLADTPRVHNTAPVSVLPSLTTPTRVHNTLPKLPSKAPTQMTPAHTQHTAKSESKAPSALTKKPAQGKKTTQPKKSTQSKLGNPQTRVDKGTFRLTENDLHILEAVREYGRLSTAHIALMTGSTTDNRKARLRLLVEKRFLSLDKTSGYNLYGITASGLERIGKNTTHLMINPAQSTVSHRNKLNTVLMMHAVGGAAFADFMTAESYSHMKAVEYEIRRHEVSNASLRRDQERIKALPTNMRTADDLKILKRKERVLPVLPDVVEFGDAGQVSKQPQVVVNERQIEHDIRNAGGALAAENSSFEIFKHFTNAMPTRAYGDDSEITDAEYEALSAAVDHNAHAFKHWNSMSYFEKKHTPDGVVVLPNRTLANGEVVGGSQWIELEDNKKDVAEYVRIFKQAIDHPLIGSVAYFTDDQQIATRLKQAKEKLYKELVGSDHRNIQQYIKEREAQQLLDSYVLIKKFMLINAKANKYGFLG